jgi:dynein heavy chain
LRGTDEIRLLLEDQQANLQTVASSKYIAAFVKNIRHWEQALNRISECIEIWLLVQKKWMYLEGIFASEDIKQQLKEDAKKFDKNDKSFKKIMELTFKSPNIYASCVTNESRLMELKTLSEELDKR